MGSSLGRIFAGDDPFAQIGASAALGTLLQQVATSLGNGEISNLATAIEGDFSSFDGALFQNLESTAAGALGSFLTADLLGALGINPNTFLGGLVNSELSATISTMVENVINGADLFSGLFEGPDVVSIAVTYLGNQLAQAIYSPDTVEGQLGAQVGSSVGAALGTIGAVDLAASSLLGSILLPGVGALVGFIVGGVIGDLIAGPTPYSLAGVHFKDGQFIQEGLESPQGGDYDATAVAYANTVAAQLNAVSQAVGGTIVDAGHSFGVGVYQKQNAYNDDKGDDSVAFADTAALMDYAVLHQLATMRFSGGDVYIERAIDATLRSAVAPTQQALSANIQIAQDYENYITNQAAINLLIEEDPNSAFAAGWVTELAMAGEMGLGTSIQGGTWNDRLRATAQQTVLIGGGGDDTYVFGKGDGYVTIDNGISLDNEQRGVLSLTDAGAVNYRRQGVDLIVTTGNSGDQVTMSGWYADSFARVDQVIYGSTRMTASLAAYYGNVAAGLPAQRPNQIPGEPGSYATTGQEAGMGVAGNSYVLPEQSSLSGGVGDDVLDGSVDADTLMAGGGDDTLIGNGGSDLYQMNAWGALTVVNGVSGGGSGGAAGELDIADGTAAGDLRYAHSGGDLVISSADGATRVTIQGWFADAYRQVATLRVGTGADAQTGTYMALADNGSFIAYTNAAGRTTEALFFTADGTKTTDYRFNADGSKEILIYNATGYSLVTQEWDANGNLVSQVGVTDAGGGGTLGGSTAGNLTLADGGSVSLTGDATVTATDISASVTASAGVSVTLAGSGATVALTAAGASAGVTASGDHLTVGAGTSVTLVGADNTLDATGATVTVATADGAVETITGSGSTIKVRSVADTLYLNASGDVVTAGSGVDPILANGNPTPVPGFGRGLTRSGCGWYIRHAA